MKASTMQVLDQNRTNLSYGVKIQVTNHRAIYVAQEEKLLSFETKKQANIRVDEVNRYLATQPQLEDVFYKNKTIKVLNF